MGRTTLIGGGHAGAGPRRARSRILCGAVLAVLVTADDVGAQEATPVAIDVGACTVEPRPEEETRALIVAGYAEVAASVAARQAAAATPAAVATPVAGATPADAERMSGDSIGAAGTPAAGTPATGMSAAGTPADAVTVAAVTETVAQFAACSRAGDLLATATLFTEAGASRYLGFSVLTFAQVSTGNATPSTDLDPALLDAFLAAIAFPVPPPREAQLTLYEVRDVVVLEDGWARATLVASLGDGAPFPEPNLLREQDGRYRLLFGPEPDDDAATPTP